MCLQSIFLDLNLFVFTGASLHRTKKENIYFDIFSHFFFQGLHNLYSMTILLELNLFAKLHLWAIITVFLTIFGHAAINSVVLPFFNN